jgi:hypothetical protein
VPAAGRYLTALKAILHRELARFLGQKSRLVAALVRPLVWLLVFAAGFRAALGLSITPPYQTYITYEVYIVPGLCGMIDRPSAARNPAANTRSQTSGRTSAAKKRPRWCRKRSDSRPTMARRAMSQWVMRARP